jgi:hypothetical protein
VDKSGGVLFAYEVTEGQVILASFSATDLTTSHSPAVSLFVCFISRIAAGSPLSTEALSSLERSRMAKNGKDGCGESNMCAFTF